MKGALTHELEVQLPAGEIWAVYGGRQLAALVVKLLPSLIEKIEIEGDGGAGTVVCITFPPGTPGPKHYKERFVKIDNENRVKEAVGIEGGLLELGFLFYLIRVEIIDKNGESSIIKSTIEYEIEEEHAANASLVTSDAVAIIAETISTHLIEKKTHLIEKKTSGSSNS